MTRPLTPRDENAAWNAAVSLMEAYLGSGSASADLPDTPNRIPEAFRALYSELLRLCSEAPSP